MTRAGSDTVTLPSRRGEAPAYLLAFDGDSCARVELPRAGAVVIGRAPDADVRVGDAAASRRHAVLTVADGEVQVDDLGSHNGTRVNGERVGAPRPLVSGDVVTIGACALVLHCAPRTWQRLHDELAHAAGRPLSLIAVAVGAARGGRAAVERAAAACLPAGAALGWEGDALLLVVLPDCAAAQPSARRLVAALAPVAPEARAGFATAPADGSDAASLIAAARAAAASATAGAVAGAASAALRVRVGERTMVVADPAMLRLIELVRRLAPRDLPVLICGETGVGKENAALALHEWSPRASRPFVALNCAAIHENLVESELFGHERGAFSGAVAAKPGLLESADGGTVFLDEIGELSPTVQAKLLRVLEAKRVARLGEVRERKVDLRLVAATHRDLEAEIRAGRFREDLYFRLAAATLVLPPLRERELEIPILARAFLDEACRAAGRPPIAIAPATLRRLAAHAWPGNVRELKNLMEYVAAVVDGNQLEPQHLPPRMASPTASAPPADPPPAAFRSVADEVRALEKRRIAEALEAAGGVQVRAAQLIGMPLRTFVNKMKQHGLGAPRRR